jgi:hypothetical protein
MSGGTEKNEITQSIATVDDRSSLVRQAEAIHEHATDIGARKIEFDNGVIYQDNGGSHVVAGNGSLVEVTKETTTVITVNSGVSLKEAVPNVANSYTQEIAAAFSNTSQSSVSLQLNPPQK